MRSKEQQQVGARRVLQNLDPPHRRTAHPSKKQNRPAHDLKQNARAEHRFAAKVQQEGMWQTSRLALLVSGTKNTCSILGCAVTRLTDPLRTPCATPHLWDHVSEILGSGKIPARRPNTCHLQPCHLTRSCVAPASRRLSRGHLALASTPRTPGVPLAWAVLCPYCCALTSPALTPVT